MWIREDLRVGLVSRYRKVSMTIAVCLPGLMSACAAKGPDRTVVRSIPGTYVEGSFVVSTAESGNDASVQSLASDVASELGCRAKPAIRVNWGDTSLGGSSAVSRGMNDTFNLTFENCDFSREGTQAILDSLATRDAVLSVEAEALATAMPLSEDDPDKSSQDHLRFIKRDKACEIAERRGETVVVAVVDSGVDIDHPDLKNSFLRDAQGEIVGANFVGAGAAMPPDRDFDDGNGHGTHVAGLIDATSNNGEGGVGVGSCANVKIMPIRVLNVAGSGSAIEIERGVKWAVDHGAHIINLSLGFTSLMRDGDTFRRPLYADLASKDVVVFAAAGNDGYVNGDDPDNSGLKRYHFPSSYDDVISVAATKNSGELTSFSNRGERVDIAAPGYALLSTTYGGGYGRMSGTSMASPVAAGAYALALATARAGLESSADRVDSRIAEGLVLSSTLEGVVLPSSSVRGRGVINVEKLVKAMAAKYPKMESPLVQDPVQPTSPVVSPAPFGFVGLVDGQSAGWPQSLKVTNLPKGTARVSFFWGDSYWSFAKVYASSPKQTSLTDEDQWYLYGSRTLTAVAYNYDGQTIGKTKVRIKGW